MPTIEECAAAFRAGQAAYREPLRGRFRFDYLLDAFNARDECASPADWMDGWNSAQREAEVERHIDDGLLK
jgi:hypothetical protein